MTKVLGEILCGPHFPTDKVCGYMMRCPGCNISHAIYVDAPDKPKWTFNGDMEKPTFNPSLRVRWNHHVCHSFIKNGEWQFLGDCTHELAGKTVPMVPWDRGDDDH